MAGTILATDRQTRARARTHTHTHTHTHMLRLCTHKYQVLLSRQKTGCTACYADGSKRTCDPLEVYTAEEEEEETNTEVGNSNVQWSNHKNCGRL